MMSYSALYLNMVLLPTMNMQSLDASCRVGGEFGEERAPTAQPMTGLANTVSKEIAPGVIQEL